MLTGTRLLTFILGHSTTTLLRRSDDNAPADHVLGPMMADAAWREGGTESPIGDTMRGRTGSGNPFQIGHDSLPISLRSPTAGDIAAL